MTNERTAYSFCYKHYTCNNKVHYIVTRKLLLGNFMTQYGGDVGTVLVIFSNHQNITLCSCHSVK